MEKITYMNPKKGKEEKASKVRPETERETKEETGIRVVREAKYFLLRYIALLQY